MVVRRAAVAPDLRFRGPSPLPRITRVSTDACFPCIPQPSRLPRLPVLSRIATPARRMPEHSPNTRYFSDPRPSRTGIFFCLLRSRCAEFSCPAPLISAPNQVVIRVFAVKDYCFSKPLITGIVRFVQAKQRAKTPTRFRAGGSCRHFREFRLTFVQTAHIFRLDFVQFAKYCAAVLCGYHKNSDLLSCNSAPSAPRHSKL